MWFIYFNSVAEEVVVWRHPVRISAGASDTLTAVLSPGK
jgi:hypothetical protein